LTSLLLISLLLAVAWFWLDSLRARELATGVAAAMCARRDLQFLDQTVALVRLGLGRSVAGLRLRRVYRFDYSEEGLGRHTGHLVMLGTAVEEFSLGLPSAPAGTAEGGAENSAAPTDDQKVIPFRRRGP